MNALFDVLWEYYYEILTGWLFVVTCLALALAKSYQKKLRRKLYL